uniref:Uncharacterized protein n=1 Tax=Zea mays TaxID=4577 RepID=C4J203_MAIZE|nr:unknown [Zea mays]
MGQRAEGHVHHRALWFRVQPLLAGARVPREPVVGAPRRHVLAGERHRPDEPCAAPQRRGVVLHEVRLQLVEAVEHLAVAPLVRSVHALEEGPALRPLLGLHHLAAPQLDAARQPRKQHERVRSSGAASTGLLRSVDSLQARENKLLPRNAIRGTPCSAAASADQSKKLSVTAASGRFSAKNRSSMVLSAGAHSTPGGRPTSGKGTTAMSMARAPSVPREASLARSTAERMSWAFTGVVRMVHLTPRAAKSAAMSAIGMRCPGARNGKKRMCSGCGSSLMAMAGCATAAAQLHSCIFYKEGYS